MSTHRTFRTFAVPVIAVLLGAARTLTAADAPADSPAPVYLDLQPKANQKLADSLHGFEGNNFAELPTGEQVFGGARFKLGDGYIRLSGRIETGSEQKKPEKVEGIPVGQSFSRLRILHGTGYGSFGKPGDPLFIAEGTAVGEYRLHYEGGAIESVPIVYGQDVRDWWNWDKPVEVTRGKEAWTGQNAFSRQQNQNIHLYLTTWSNPHPEKKVLSIDYVCNEKGAASPFCIAISLEK